MSVEEPPPYAIASVDKALQVALLLGQGRAFRVAELAAELDVARSTAHRLLAMLVFRGFAEQTESRAYRAGPVLARRGSGTQLVDLRPVVHPHLVALSRLHDETAHLMVMRGREVLFCESVEGTQPLRISSREGAVMPAHLSSGGKAILAELGPERLHGLYADAPADEQPDVDLLRLTLETVQRRRYALNLGETERGIHAIGVAIHERGGGVVGAISLSMPSLRMPRRRVVDLAATVRAAATDIDADLAR